MREKAKVAIALLIILLLISLSSAGGLYYFLQKEHAQNLALQEELDDIKTRLKVTEAKLNDYEKIIAETETRLQEAKTQMEMLTRDLEQEKTAKQDALNRIEQLRIELENQKVLRSDLEKRITQAQKDIEKTQAQLKELESKKTELEIKLNELGAKSESVELGTIMVTPEGAVPLEETSKAVLLEKPKGKPAKTEGKILVINKENNFVVIDLGSKDGVALDNIFAIYHNNKYVGDVKVEKIHDSMSAAGLVSPKIKDKISEGDKVLLKTKSKWSIF